MRKITLILLVLAAVGGLAFLSRSLVETYGNERLRSATRVLDQVTRGEDRGIPGFVLAGARAIAIFPDAVMDGPLAGGRFGAGALTVRTSDGGWSRPVFVDLTGGSIGEQSASPVNDTILVFNNDRAVRALERGTLFLGADATVAGGPLSGDGGREGAPIRSVDVYSYSRGPNHFAGVAVYGAMVSVDGLTTLRFYGGGGSLEAILAGGRRDGPESATVMTCEVARRTETRMGEC